MSSANERRVRATEDAAAWQIRLETESLSEAEQAQFADWLRESPVHVAEMLRVSRLQYALKRYSQRGMILPPTAPITPGTDVVTLLNPGHAVSSPRLRQPVLIALAATVASLVLGVVMYFSSSAPTIYHTQPGERRELELADGSDITVGPNSEIQVSLGKYQRLAVLKRGEVFFRVAKDSHRPFIVDAGGARTRDIGTAFSIERSQDLIVVTVVEGRVDVTPVNEGGHFDVNGSGEVQSFSLGKDQQIAITGASRAVPVRNVNSQAEASWAQGQLVFDNARVDDIARRFNQFNRAQIRIANDNLASKLITGVFREDDPNSFAELLTVEAGASIHRGNDDEIIIDVSAAQPEGSVPH